MENEFKRIIVDSSIAKPSYLSGHTHTISRPCTVYGVWNARTGTILLEYVWCDGNHYSSKDLDRDDCLRLLEQLRQAILDAEMGSE